MFLSIIIPVHNTEKYIRDCLDSCLAQDISQDEYELICVDDYSSDRSLEILREYEKNYDSVHIISFHKNRGVSEARNAGIEAMQGDYCMFLDSDDYLADNCLKRMREMLSQTREKTILCVGRYHFTEEGTADRHANTACGEYLGCPTERYITNRLIPSALVSQFQFQENIAYGEDEVFCLELDLLNPVYMKLDEPVYYYRRHSESAMSMTPEKQRKQFDSVVNSGVYVINKYGCHDEKIRTFVRERIGIAFHYIRRQPALKKYKLLRQMSAQGLYFPPQSGCFCYPIEVAYFKLTFYRLKSNILSFLLKHFPTLKRLRDWTKRVVTQGQSRSNHAEDRFE